ncbi:MAG TPA: hypothetical protein V6D06_00320 [Trichocoleus sp.]
MAHCALISPPKIVLAYEPTTALDKKSGRDGMNYRIVHMEDGNPTQDSGLSVVA